MLKTNTKKKICMILIVSMLFSILPVGAFAEENSTVTSGSCGENTTWQFDSATCILTLEGEGAITEYVWNRMVDVVDVKEVVIGAGITGFDEWNLDNPFASLPSLQKFTVEKENARFIAEDGVLFDTKSKEQYDGSGRCYITEGEYVKKLISYPAQKNMNENDGAYTIPDDVHAIGAHAFADAKLKQIFFEAAPGNDNLRMIDNQAFSGCWNLTKLIIPDSVSVLRSVGPSGLQRIEIGSGMRKLGEYNDGDRIAYRNPFYGCEYLGEIVISEWNDSYRVVEGVLFDSDMTVLYCYPVSKTDTSYIIPDTVITVAHDAFWLSDNLQQLTYGSSVKESGEITGLCLSKLKLNELYISHCGEEFTEYEDSARRLYSKVHCLRCCQSRNAGDQLHKAGTQFIFKRRVVCKILPCQRKIDQSYLVSRGVNIDPLERNIQVLAGQEAIMLNLHHVVENIGHDGQKALRIHGRQQHGKRLQRCGQIIQLNLAVVLHFHAVAYLALEHFILSYQKQVVIT